jgi:hypothetical protein
MSNLLLLLVVSFLPFTAQAVSFDSDVPAEIKAQILQDLEFMKSLKGDKVTPLHQQIFGGMDGSYYNWFDTRVTDVGMNSCGNPNAVACVIPMFGSSQIWLTQNYVKFSHPQIAKMMVVFHEARHTETNNRNWGHASCPRPFLDADGRDMKSIWTGAPLAGEPACDATPFGSYGSSTILLKNVSKFCASCTEKVKMDAGIYSDDQLKRVTNASAKDQMQKDFATK